MAAEQAEPGLGTLEQQMTALGWAKPESTNVSVSVPNGNGRVADGAVDVLAMVIPPSMLKLLKLQLPTKILA